TPWRIALRAMCDALTALFERPRSDRFERALKATSEAIEAMQALLTALAFAPPRDERHRLQRILSQLHFIRTALLDPQSPLEPWTGARADAPADAPKGASHAA
ncbi:MAG: FUSC family protein, partial [Paraburkholderia graminis]